MENIVNMNEMMRQNLFDRGSNVDYCSHTVSQNGGRTNMAENMKCNLDLGICSVPMQEWEQVYDEDTAFSAGTIFPCLNKPFLGGGK